MMHSLYIYMMKYRSKVVNYLIQYMMHIFKQSMDVVKHHIIHKCGASNQVKGCGSSKE